MLGAINAVLSGTMGYLKASKSYNVPQSTLEDRVKKARQEASLEEASKKGMGRYKTVFSDEQENELVEYILLLESRLFGLTFKEL